MNSSAPIFLVLLVLVLGCGAIAVHVQTGMLTHVGVATVWGLIVMTMIDSIGD